MFLFTTPSRPALRSAQTHLEGVPRLVGRGMMLAIPEHPRPYVFVVGYLIKSKDNTFTFIIHTLHKLQSEFSAELHNSIAQQINKRHKIRSSLNSNLQKVIFFIDSGNEC